jgi:hypothetical protein
MTYLLINIKFFSIFFLFSCCSIAQSFSPSNLSNLSVWLKAENASEINGTFHWFDSSNNNFHCSQSNVNFSPQIISQDPMLSNKPTLFFDGIDDFLNGAIIPNINSSSLTIFCVASGGEIQTSERGLFSINNYNNGFWFQRGSSQPSLMIWNQNEFIRNNNSLPNQAFNYKILGGIKKLNQSTSLYINGNQIASSNNPTLSGVFTNTNYTVGKSLSNWLGNIAEIIIYDRDLNSLERQQVEKYLMDKYAPPVNLGSDINNSYGFCDITLVPQGGYYLNYLWSTGSITSSININNPGTYWVEATDIFGRISRDTIQVFRPVYDDIQLNSQIICSNESFIANANIPSGSYSFVQWSDGLTDPSRLINSAQALSYTVSDNTSCIRTSNLATFSIDSSLQNISLGSDTSLCSGNNIQLQNAPAGITAYAWNTGNTQATQTVDTSGLYILEVTNTNNCHNRDTIQVQVIGTSPTLQFAFSDTLCQFSPGSYLDSSFVPNGNGTISSKTWFISQGDTLIGSSGSFSIDTSGVFNVTLLVQTQEGCSSSATFPLVVYPKPIVSFNSEKFCPYDAVEFTSFNSQLSSLSSQVWSFDDNTTSTSPNPSHVFGTTDTYNVSLQAEDINGCRDTVFQVVYIQPAPVADFTFNNTCELSAVNFVNNSNIADTFSLSLSQWTYGDGTASTNPAIQKVYQAYGDYNVRLVVTANNGCQDTLTQTITIHPKPILGWQISPACKNTWTTFENQSTIPLGSIAETDWLVNLQYPQEGTSSAYKFVTTGFQYLNLTSTSDQGCTTDTLIIVNVQSEINAAYSVSPTTVVAGVPIVFTNSSLGGNSYEWNLGNGNIIQTLVSEPVEATGFTSSFIGDSILTYLAIQNTIGCKDTAYQYVKVNEPRIDLAINQLFVQDINGFYKVGVELRNLGFVEITQTDLLLKLYNSSPILETETESLAPGESRIYLFNANPSAFISTQDNEISYLCVEATSYNDYQLIETELSNNISCLNTEGGNFVLLPIYPNPTNNDVTYTLIVSEESTISTSLTDETGRIVQSSTELFASGLHTPTISMRNLSAGVYYFQISDGVTSKTVKVLKN